MRKFEPTGVRTTSGRSSISERFAKFIPFGRELLGDDGTILCGAPDAVLVFVRARWDRYDKDTLAAGLAGSGEAILEAEVVGEAQYIDVLYEPDPAREELRRARGLLGRMARAPCAFEPFHDAPSIDEVLECARKQLTLHHTKVLASKGRRRSSVRAVLPAMWILSGSHPRRALEQLDWACAAGWEPGIYALNAKWPLFLVSIGELPKTRDTLLLRLLGRGRVLRAAIEELGALPSDAWERAAAIPPLVRLRLTIPRDPTLRSLEDEELEMTTRDIYDEWLEKHQNEARARGLAEGRRQGRRQGLEKGLEKGLSALRSALLAVLEARFGEISDELRAAVERLETPERIVELTAAASTKPLVEVGRLISGPVHRKSPRSKRH